MDNTRNTRGTNQRETGQSPFRPFQNSSNGSQGQSDGPTQPGTPGSRRRFWLQWLLFIIIINLLFYLPLLFSSLSAQQPTISLSYTSFLQQVQQGNVKDVTLTGNTVSGDFKTPLKQQQSGTSQRDTLPDPALRWLQVHAAVAAGRRHLWHGRHGAQQGETLQ